MEKNTKEKRKELQMREKHKGKREACCAKRRKANKKIERRQGKRKQHRMSKMWQKERMRDDMTW